MMKGIALSRGKIVGNSGVNCENRCSRIGLNFWKPVSQIRLLRFCRWFLGCYLCSPIFGLRLGELAQLARALAWHARGRRFDSDILHKNEKRVSNQ
jgi:hypothetical protein